MKNLIVISILLFLLWGSPTYTQDTLALEPASGLRGGNPYIENNRLATTLFDNCDNRHFIIIYDVTNPFDPDSVTSFSGLALPHGNERALYFGKITGLLFIEDVVLWNTCQQYRCPIGDYFGPVLLHGKQLSNEDGWRWNRELLEQIDYELGYLYPGNITRYGDYLVVAGGHAGIKIFDISDIENPNPVSFIDYQSESMVIIEDCIIFFLNDPNPRFGIFNISDPEQPRYIHRFSINWHRCPYVSQADNVIYNNCLVLKNNYRLESNSSLLLLDVLSDGDPRDGEVIDLGREYGAYRFYIENNRLFIQPSGEDFVDIYNIDDNLDVEYIATISLSVVPDRHFMVRDNKMIFAWNQSLIIYVIPPELAIPSTTKPPGNFQLHVYPNPFNSSVNISYSLPLAQPVTLGIYNTRGQLVDVLLDRVVPAGRHSVVWDAKGVSTGMYLVRMKDETGSMKGMQKMVFMR